jgi:hypothetical protein
MHYKLCIFLLKLQEIEKKTLIIFPKTFSILLNCKINMTKIIVWALNKVYNKGFIIFDVYIRQSIYGITQYNFNRKLV